MKFLNLFYLVLLSSISKCDEIEVDTPVETPKDSTSDFYIKYAASEQQI